MINRIMGNISHSMRAFTFVLQLAIYMTICAMLWNQSLCVLVMYVVILMLVYNIVLIAL